MAGTALAVMALAWSLAALATVGLLMLLRRPPRLDPARRGQDPPANGPPPAVVQLLTGGFEVGWAGPAATLLDLAARRIVDLERYGHRTLCRLRDTTGATTPYERRVVDRVQRHADRGVVPVDVLGFRSPTAAQRWLRSFARDVIDDAQTRGLCRPRWSWLHVGAVTVAGVITFVLAAAAGVTTDPAGPPPTTETIRGMAALGGVALWGIAGRMARSQRQLPHPAGRQEAARWLGVREKLAATDLAEHPAAGAVVWERRMSYGAALGVARGALADLPFGLDEDRHGWSRVTGRWRPVRVAYPRLRPAWGLHPVRAVLRGVVLGPLAIGLAWIVRRIGDDPSTFIEIAGVDVGRPIEQVWPVLAGIAALVVAYAAVVLAAGLLDLFATSEVQGVVLRCRERSFVPRRFRRVWRRVTGGNGAPASQPGMRRYVAVDDGTEDEITAWAVTAQVFGSADEGRRVRVRVTPRLGHVRSIEPAPRSD